MHQIPETVHNEGPLLLPVAGEVCVGLQLATNPHGSLSCQVEHGHVLGEMPARIGDVQRRLLFVSCYQQFSNMSIGLKAPVSTQTPMPASLSAARVSPTSSCNLSSTPVAPSNVSRSSRPRKT